MRPTTVLRLSLRSWWSMVEAGPGKRRRWPGPLSMPGFRKAQISEKDNPGLGEVAETGFRLAQRSAAADVVRYDRPVQRLRRKPGRCIPAGHPAGCGPARAAGF